MSFFFHFKGGQTGDLESFQSPLVWWDFSDADTLTLTGSALDEAANKGTGGSGYDLLHNSGVQITVTDGEAACNGSQNDYRSGVAGDYDFMHDGTGSHVFYIMEHDSADTGENFLHITNITSSNAAGSRFTSDQASDNNRYRSITGLGASNLTHASAIGTLPEDIYTIAEHTIETVAGTDDIVMRDDGVVVASNTDGGLLSGSSHADVARFFVSGACKVKGVLIFNRRLSDAERYAVYRKAASYYSLPAMNVSMVIGDSNAGMQNAASGLSANYDAIIPYAYTWAYEDGNTANDLAFWPMEASHGAFDFTSSNAGPELAFAYTIAQATGEKEYVLKSYENGSDLYAKWHPSDFPSLNTAWDEFVDRVDEVKAWASKMGRSIAWRGCWQILGHNDCSASFRANNYENNLGDLNAAIRNLTRSDLPIVVTLTSLEGLDNPDAGFATAALQETVRGGISSVGNTESNTFAYQPLNSSVSDLAYNETSPDGIHYNTATMEDMGEDVGTGITATSVPVVSTAPTIDTSNGTAEGSILFLDVGVWTNGILEAESIQWKRDGVAISGETGWQYVRAAADAGTDLTVTFTPKNNAGAGTEVTTAAVSIPAFTPMGGVVASTVLDLDATVSSSYSGSGQTWANIETTPADSETQTTYDFALGATTSASTDDPTFNGTAGDAAAYFSNDGGDRFRLIAANTNYINQIHQVANGEQDFTMVFAFKMPASGFLRPFVTGITGGSTPGLLLEVRPDSGTPNVQLYQAGDTGNAVIVYNTANVPAFSDEVLLGIGYEYSTGTARYWMNTTTATETTPGALNACASAASQKPDVFGYGTANGTRMYAFSMYNALLTNAQFADVAAEYGSRHNRTYV